MRRKCNEAVGGGECAADDDRLRRCLPVFHPLCDHLHVGQRQNAHRFTDERCFFAVAFQRRHCQLRPHDGEHQRGQTGTAADIGERCRVFYIRQHGKAIEHVARHLFFSVAYGGQVMHLIPFVEQVEIADELRAFCR